MRWWPTVNEILAARPSVNSFNGTPLSTPFEQNDKDMPKARRSQSVGQFPSTPNKHKVGNGNSKSCPPGRQKSSPPEDMVKKPSKGGKESRANKGGRLFKRCFEVNPFITFPGDSC